MNLLQNYCPNYDRSAFYIKEISLIFLFSIADLNCVLLKVRVIKEAIRYIDQLNAAIAERLIAIQGAFRLSFHKSGFFVVLPESCVE